MERHEILERNSVKSSNSLSGNERQYMYVRSQYLWGTWSAMQYNKTIYMYACPQPYDISPPPPFIQVVPLRLHIGRALASVVSRRSDDLYHTNWSILQSSRCRYIAVTWTGDSEKKNEKKGPNKYRFAVLLAMLGSREVCNDRWYNKQCKDNEQLWRSWEAKPSLRNVPEIRT